MKTSSLSSLRRPALIALAAGVLTAAQAPHARAALAVTDQSNTVSGQPGSQGSGSTPYANVVGESFTPGLAVMNAATFSLDTTTTATLTLNVYAGAGFGGTLLGTSAPLTIFNASLATVEFDLPSVVALTPGSTYTLGLTLGTFGSLGVAITPSNAYAGGILYFSSATYPNYDAIFAEGLTSASLLPTGVPEPSTWAAVALGAGLLGGVTLRRHRV